jgi:hypothetical protein
MVSFDTIIYGASWYGVVRALKEAREGHKVALFHRYGFPGGFLSTAFSICQYVDDNLPDSNTITGELYQDILHEKGGILKFGMSFVLMNPEIIKMKLLHHLSQSPVHLLFYAVPVSVKKKDLFWEITFYQREGLTNYTCHTLLDASENVSLERLIRPVERINHNLYHCFVRSSRKPEYEDITDCIKLENDRWWISVAFETSSEDPSLAMHRSLDRLHHAMSSQNGVIQLIPMQAESLYRFKNGEKSEISPLFIDEAEDIKKIVLNTSKGEKHDTKNPE